MLVDQPRDLLPQLILFLHVRRINEPIKRNPTLGLIATVTGNTMRLQEWSDVASKVTFRRWLNGFL